ncbi:MAG: hypothetical protein CME62_06895 [Halobacteriovoraceae bacterium]|nr:hypothetical protein [Halobacteriovoraceae bacterium]
MNKCFLITILLSLSLGFNTSLKAEERSQIQIITFDSLDAKPSCYAVLYQKRDFRGEGITLKGERLIQNLGYEFLNKQSIGFISSLVIGPGASLELYRNGFTEPADYYFKANDEVPYLSFEEQNITGLHLKCIELTKIE